jgi:hypothetical protein
VSRHHPVALALGLVLSAASARGAVKPGLEGAQELFRQNRWEDARAHLRAQWGQVAEKDRGAATFLIGRSHVREAEFYRALRRLGDEIGIAYFEELKASKTKGVWAPLFEGLYRLDADQDAAAEKMLTTSPRSTLPAEWKSTARVRRALALHRLGRAALAGPGLKETTAEARFASLLLNGTAEAPQLSAKPERREKLLAAAILFRLGRGPEAEALLLGLNLDLPDVEDTSDPKKLLRFHDPVVARAWERIAWERAVFVLTPLASRGTGNEKILAAHYLGLSLFRLGALEAATPHLKVSAASSLGDVPVTARLLLAAAAWKAKAPTAAELAALWEGTQAQPEAVLLWDELRRSELLKTEPFATKLEPRLRDLLSASTERPSGSLVGRWGLARLRGGEDSGAIVAALSEHRDKSNKNKLEWNDPLLLLALSAASYRDNEYAQSLETLFELSKTLPGLRAVQWNLQGIYAARQKAGGEARISQ